MAPTAILTGIVTVAVFISAASALQLTLSASGGSPLRFVSQLNVNGCSLFAHLTGESDGPHLVVEPAMCVTNNALQRALLRYDRIAQQTYVSVPVMITDDLMLAEVRRLLGHLAPKSVKFATVSDISVSADVSSRYPALGFDWTIGASTGILRIGCINAAKKTDCMCILNPSGKNLLAVYVDIFSRVKLLAELAVAGGVKSRLTYKPMMQSISLIDTSIYSARYVSPPTCTQLRFTRSIRFKDSTARVHERLDKRGHFLIEPLFQLRTKYTSNESIMYDYSNGMYYLKLDVVLQDDFAVAAVRTQLAGLSPRSVSFMLLWHAQNVVSSWFTGRFNIGPFMVSADWRSAQLRVTCRTLGDCRNLRSSAVSDWFSHGKEFNLAVTSLVDHTCLHLSPKSTWFPTSKVNNSTAMPWETKCPSISYPACARFQHLGIGCPMKRLPDGRQFAIVQQRKTSTVSFQRTWREYERGFGNSTDFWIGLFAIHSLSQNGTTLRVEMKLWSGTELHVEYDGFTVLDDVDNFRMTYQRMASERTTANIRGDAMAESEGAQFSTMERDNDDYYRPCSSINGGGKAGWWFKACNNCNPNGLLSDSEIRDENYVFWKHASTTLYPSEIRLMLQI